MTTTTEVTTERWVPWRNSYGLIVGPRIHDAARQCKYCASFWGYDGDCPPTTCMACGARQCMANGLGNGHCKVCYVGWLNGWSGSTGTCQRARCNEPHVGTLRKRNVCAKHLGDVTQHTAIMVAIDERTMRPLA